MTEKKEQNNCPPPQAHRTWLDSVVDSLVIGVPIVAVVGYLSHEIFQLLK